MKKKMYAGILRLQSYCVRCAVRDGWVEHEVIKCVPKKKYSRVQNKRSPTIINFWTFFQGLWPYSGLHSIR